MCEEQRRREVLCALLRYSSTVRAVCVNALARICAGAVSDGHPYHDSYLAYHTRNCGAVAPPLAAQCLMSRMSESAAIIKVFFRSTIAHDYSCGYTTSGRSGR